MRVNRISTLPGYLAYIPAYPPEVDELFKDLLISVTNFFRDEKAFDTFQKAVISQIVEGKNSEGSIRVTLCLKKICILPLPAQRK